MIQKPINMVFAEKDNLFRLMEIALRRAPTPEGEKTLHYFFGEDIAAPLGALTGMADRLGLPSAIDVTVCGDEAALVRSLGTADVIVLQNTTLDAVRLKACTGRVRLVQQFGRLTGNIDVAAAARLGVPVANLTRLSTLSCADHITALILARRVNCCRRIVRLSRGTTLRCLPFLRTIRRATSSTGPAFAVSAFWRRARSASSVSARFPAWWRSACGPWARAFYILSARL